MPDVPVIIDTNAQLVLDELKADFQTRTGRVLQDGQAETLLLSAWAYREALLRSQIQNAATQNLVDFAIAPVLDYLGRLVGVTRLPAEPAVISLTFTLVTGHGAGTIPAGTRVASVDNLVQFNTLEAAAYESGDATVVIPSACTTEGVAGNGYAPGAISVLLDPIAAVASVANATATASGSDAETDDQLRERIKIASSSFSTAGSRQSYIFHAKSAHPSITDVVVNSSVPGVVNIFPKVTGGAETPSEVITAVQIACSAETVRPLTDTVVVATPTQVPYTLELEIVTYETADQAVTLAAVLAALDDLNTRKSNAMGQDVLTEHIIGACMVSGVYSVDLGAFTSITVDETEFAYCTDIAVTITGTTNG